MIDQYECPKCGVVYEPVGSHEEDAGERECEDCGFLFIVEIEYEPTYSTRCVEHQWGEPEHHWPYTARYCQHCGSVDPKSIVDHPEETPCGPPPS